MVYPCLVAVLLLVVHHDLMMARLFLMQVAQSVLLYLEAQKEFL